jgi:hypothetical protein
MSTYAERGLLSRRATPMGVIIRRGLLAGLAGGVAMAAFLLLVGEASIREALALEAARSEGGHGDEMFSRGVQVTGGAIAALIYGVLLGAVFAVVYTAIRPPCAINAFRRSLGLGAIGYVTIVLVPAVKYPANPPGVGDPDTIGLRTASYLTLLCASILLAILARALWARLRDRGIAEEVRVVVSAERGSSPRRSPSSSGRPTPTRSLYRRNCSGGSVWRRWAEPSLSGRPLRSASVG